MNQDLLKQKAADKALEMIEDGITLGVGSGSTVLKFVAALGKSSLQFKDVVSSSEETTAALKAAGYQVRDLNACDAVDVYVDGCDEIDGNKYMIKGGGAALTREKIVAAAAKKFICIADESKAVDVLGRFPLPVEVIPMARSLVGRALLALGGEPRWREGVVTDNGNWIIDVHHLRISDPYALEAEINNIAGVVTNGIFARQAADVLILSRANGEIDVQ
ncbi:ribose-5-phosphate isomerase RpiA [Suttonella sp. R2A3]|uniref:ribose-5-phosphate isomerase RpiA n=1 Tax=Suttonella sp. R2A3 TaxID=2908648 RepID=UPI001F41F53B|nr:ribose-5-phosphate isomerase RpiA [Suttonella sp. R2A3]UJF24831.1 ribose-5-phosphate isomerase RpiA [Suttonella sp. R2A3]